MRRIELPTAPLSPARRWTAARIGRAFTLIELLVSITIILLLAGLLSMAATKSLNRGRRAVCLNNVRQQYMAQVIYAEDFDGRFSKHADFAPGYHRSGFTTPQNIFDAMRGKYLSEPWVTICPYSAKYWGNFYPHFGDPSKVQNLLYGGWASSAANISTAYFWFANYLDARFTDDAGNFAPASPSLEPSWPRALNECDSRKAFITHRIAVQSDLASFADWSHNPPSKSKNPKDLNPREQPVGMADGSAQIHFKRQIRPRAYDTKVNEFYWY